MDRVMLEQLVIIGSGCAGLTAAIYAARANLAPLVIEGNQPLGQLSTTSEIENFPGFPEGINGYELMERLRQQAERFGTHFLSAHVDRAELREKCLYCGDQKIQYRATIIATGAEPRMLNIRGGRECFGGKGVSVCATCDGAFFKNREVVVIGGGDSACEEANFLTHFCSKVTIIHRRDQFRASKIMAERVLNSPKIEVLWNTVPLKICGDQKVTHVRVRSGDREQDLQCSGVFLAIGHIPNTTIFKDQLSLDANGYFTSIGATEIPGVFTAGDCCDAHYRQAITAAGMGAAAAILAERFLLSS
ncbi:MAG: thioredoxin-disulfide reductase [Opitutales bacterium]|nr:thioredoxin-disulfide reductase [Opitutales bacterium]